MPGPTVPVGSKVCKEIGPRLAEELIGDRLAEEQIGPRLAAVAGIVAGEAVRRDREAVGSDRPARSQLSAIDLKQEKTFVQRTPQIRMPLCSRAAAMARQFVPSSLVAAILVFLLSAGPSFAQQGNEKTFASPGDAVLALYNALKSSDSQALNSIFGASAGEILHTGDDVADKNTAAKFISHYEQMHRVVIEPDQSATLYLGAENWPFPISIVKNSSGAWYFDTEAGKQEILYRRIGTNENDAIDILHGMVDAQRDYASEPRDGDTTKHYALKFISSEGKQDGLYWKTSGDEAPSPIGPQIVAAATQGYTYQQGKQAPFHGYYYRILTKQGAAAKGGVRDYIVNGELTRGFAFVAYPAQYRNSGVMTFIVNQDGLVYQKDLGPDTSNLASTMTEYNPDKTWSPAD